MGAEIELTPPSVLCVSKRSLSQAEHCTLYVRAEESDIVLATQTVSRLDYFKTRGAYRREANRRNKECRDRYFDKTAEAVEALGFNRGQADKITREATPTYALRAVVWADDLLNALGRKPKCLDADLGFSQLCDFGQSIVSGFNIGQGTGLLILSMLGLPIPKLSGSSLGRLMMGAEWAIYYRRSNSVGGGQ
jgi:hypothetical protein